MLQPHLRAKGDGARFIPGPQSALADLKAFQQWLQRYHYFKHWWRETNPGESHQLKKSYKRSILKAIVWLCSFQSLACFSLFSQSYWCFCLCLRVWKIGWGRKIDIQLCFISWKHKSHQSALWQRYFSTFHVKLCFAQVGGNQKIWRLFSHTCPFHWLSIDYLLWTTVHSLA